MTDQMLIDVEDKLAYFGKTGDVSIVDDNVILNGENGSQQTVGVLLPEERRIEWDVEVTDVLKERIAGERDEYKEWAESVSSKVVANAPVLETSSRDSEKWWEYLREEFPEVDEYLPSALHDLSDKKILDVGGSMKDSWRFMWYGNAASIDHLEVSPETQHLALEKLTKMYQNAPELLDRYVFHTAPAENMPFKDNVFDFVFSRSTIHHTKRPESFMEISRVLKPGGAFLMFEPKLPESVHLMMRAVRVLRQADRGTDSPLREFEFNELRKMLNVEYFSPTRPFEGYILFFLPFLAKNHLEKIKNFDKKMKATWLGRKFGKNFVLLATKPA